MKYTKYGLQISFDELEQLLQRAKNEAKYSNMENCIYIQGSEKPTIKQYCCYAECSPINYTYLAR